ncbi:MAG: protocatechuate 3,4-dioxygenase [Bdellovibrionia bacterium]
METTMNRRKMIKLGLGSAGAVFFSSSLPKAIASSCGITPAQTSGPFFPGESEFDLNSDLTQFSGQTARPLGEIIYIKGKVQNEKCEPIARAQIEIWQACASGRYQHPADDNPAPLDPNFRYWGETMSNDQGEYLFKTIIPGAYPAADDWIRPPHIHFKVARLGYHELTTQMYFKGNIYNDADKILREIPASHRGSVVIEFKKIPTSPEAGAKGGTFDLTLKAIS